MAFRNAIADRPNMIHSGIRNMMAYFEQEIGVAYPWA